MLSPVVRTSVVDEIVAQLCAIIRAGELGPGDPVPNEHRLAQEFDVGRSSVREALRALQALGIVERGPEGTTVAPGATLTLAHHDLRRDLFARSLELVHLFEARRLVEGEIAALAASRVDRGALTELKDLASQMRATATTAFERYFALDMEFHRALCAIAANPVLGQFWSVAHELLLRARPELTGVNGLIDLSNANHDQLLAALAIGDEAAARATAHDALARVEALVLTALRFTTDLEEAR